MTVFTLLFEEYPAFVVYLYNEIYLYRNRFSFLDVGSNRHFLACAAYDTFPAACGSVVFRGSPRMYHWLLAHKYLGPYIRSFREEKAIPLRAKIISVSLLWITGLHCVLFLFPYWWLKGMMALVTIGVTIIFCHLKLAQPDE